MNFRLIKFAAAAAALLATPFAAVAADMKTPVYKGVPRSVIAYYNWTGFYVGATVGYGSGSSDWIVPPSTTVASNSPKGMMYGLTAGYNWQVGSFVYGLEADYSFSNVKGSTTCVVVSTCETSNTWLATFRGRVGYAFDRFLPYVTGGGAYGNINGTVTTPLLGTVLDGSESRFGWTFGAGLEYAFLANWTAKIEYLYVDLGTAQPFSSLGALTQVTFKENILRGGLNYRF